MLEWWASIAIAAEPIVVASKSFPESRLLGEIMAQALERDGRSPVERRLDLGYSTIVFESLKAGDIDVYAEYTGTAWQEYLKIPRKVSDPLEAYATVSARMERELGLVWLQPFGFQNSFALAMSERRADELGVVSISDLVGHGSALRVGVSADFLQRNDGYQALADAYGIHAGSVRTMDHGLVYQAVDLGEVDLVDVWTTDGKLARYDLRVLVDDRGFFPPYHAAPIVRAEVLARHPEVAEVLNRLAFTIDNETMQRLNARVEDLRSDPAPYEKVAAEFLRGEVAREEAGADQAARPGNFATFFLGRLDRTVALAARHLWLTGAAVGLAILVAVPVGIGLTRRPAVAPAVLGMAGIIQTIPSLALLAVMIPILGLGVKAAVAALFLYALLPIVRNTFTGIREVDGQLLEAARGIGLTDWQILGRVQLPLAAVTIMAGVRTSAVISVGVATLAAFVGAGGLGQPIVTGLQLNDTNWILSGALPAAGLALGVDLLLGWVEGRLRPRGLG